MGYKRQQSKGAVTLPSVSYSPAHPLCGIDIVCYGRQMLQPAEHWLLSQLSAPLLFRLREKSQL